MTSCSRKGIELLCLFGVPGRVVSMFEGISERPAHIFEYASAHQPSSSDKLRPPVDQHLHWPLVPQASHGRRGVFNQRSTPCHQVLGHSHVIVGEEHHV